MEECRRGRQDEVGGREPTFWDGCSYPSGLAGDNTVCEDRGRGCQCCCCHSRLREDGRTPSASVTLTLYDQQGSPVGACVLCASV